MAGGEGDDVLSGGAGIDLMDGGTGVDTLSYAGAAAAIRLEWWSNQVTIDGDGGNDIFDNIERVVGSANNDFLGGRNVDDVLIGGAGDDVMYGFNGADEMTGGSGSDAMSGGDGDDVLTGGLGVDYIEGAAGIDTASYAGAGSGITVSLWNMLVTNDGDGSNDFLGNIERIVGSNFNDMLQGSNNADFLVGGGADDVLYGFGGVDALEGGSGIDHLFGGADADSFHFGNGSGTDYIYDFNALDGDKIHLASGINGSAITDGATALAATSYASGNAWIQLGGGNWILVMGVAPGSLSANEFVIL
jgi:Ca2+-binding RTX toxin-like protein